jgi:xanthine dehydrogenase accessory factor
MSGTAKSLQAFLDASPLAALVEVAEAKGSTPREKGAWMLVSSEGIFGTIGGGQLEFMAIARAREMLTDEGQRDSEGLLLDIPLGPEIGQCCGGRVEVSIRVADAAVRSMLFEQAEAEDARLPHIYLFGGGHVGHALASAFALLPVHVVVVETRADALESMPESTETRLTPVPEEMVRDAPVGSAFVVLTHDHALDFLIVAEALKREDAAYVGMIGSKTKKATFRSWYLKTAGGSEADFARLVSPIGGDQVKDKRPAVIAALAAAEIMTALAR